MPDWCTVYGKLSPGLDKLSKLETNDISSKMSLRGEITGGDGKTGL